MLVKGHQPIGHAQIADVMHLADGAEGGRIFAVRVDHHDMAARCQFADAVEDQRGRGRLARAGRADQREMPAEQRIDCERRGYAARRIDGADPDAGAGRAIMDGSQFGIGDRMHRRAGQRIGGHTAPKAVERAGFRLAQAFADQLDLGLYRGRVARRVERQGTDRADDPAIRAPDLHWHRHLPRRRQHRIVLTGERRHRLAVEDDAPRRAAHRQQPPDHGRIVRRSQVSGKTGRG